MVQTPPGFDKCIQFPFFTKTLISSIEVDDDDGTTSQELLLLYPMMKKKTFERTEKTEEKGSQLEMRFSPTGLLMQISFFLYFLLPEY